MFMNNFIVVIKNNGNIMREINGSVKLPFGSEYSILLKNKDSRTAVASIEIDGEDVMGGHRYIVPGNSTRELKGFLKGMNANNRFRFIKKTKEISKFRGDRLDDGLIRVEFWYEQKQRQPWILYNNCPIQLRDRSSDSSGGIGTHQFIYTSNTSGFTKNGSAVITAAYNISQPLLDEGITVKGSKTNQQFHYGCVGTLETNSSVIIIKLIGETKRADRVVKIKKPITVRTRIQCPTCGRKWKPT
ncbi:unnamed protein product, partial [marine sediment metagenome]